MNSNSGRSTRFRTLVAVIIVCLIEVGAHFWYRSTRPKNAKRHSVVAVGVGMYLARSKETHKYVITRIFPHSPAEAAGLTPGLTLNKIDNALTETNKLKNLTALLMGPAGSKVVLEIIDSNDNTNQIQLTREQFVNHSRP